MENLVPPSLNMYVVFDAEKRRDRTDSVIPFGTFSQLGLFYCTIHSEGSRKENEASVFYFFVKLG